MGIQHHLALGIEGHYFERLHRLTNPIHGFITPHMNRPTLLRCLRRTSLKTLVRSCQHTTVGSPFAHWCWIHFRRGNQSLPCNHFFERFCWRIPLPTTNGELPLSL